MRRDQEIEENSPAYWETVSEEEAARIRVAEDMQYFDEDLSDEMEAEGYDLMGGMDS